jgi:hypothetical protein
VRRPPRCAPAGRASGARPDRLATGHVGRGGGLSIAGCRAARRLPSSRARPSGSATEAPFVSYSKRRRGGSWPLRSSGPVSTASGSRSRPKINRSGDRSRTGARSKAGSGTLRWAVVEAAQHAWRPTNPWHQLHTEAAKRAGKNPAKARRRPQDPDRRLAHPLPPTSLQACRATPVRSCLGKLPLLSGRLTALHGIEKPRQLPRTLCADPSAEREMSPPHTPRAPTHKGGA